MFAAAKVMALLALFSTIPTAPGAGLTQQVTGISDIINALLQDIKERAAAVDPVSLENWSVSILGQSISIESGSVSGFSDLSTILTIDESTGAITGTISVGTITASATNLAISSDLIEATLSSASLTLEGATVSIDMVYDEEAQKATSLTVVLKIGSVKGAATIDIAGTSLDLEFDLSEQVDTINQWLENQSAAISRVLLEVFNAVICWYLN